MPTPIGQYGGINPAANPTLPMQQKPDGTFAYAPQTAGVDGLPGAQTYSADDYTNWYTQTMGRAPDQAFLTNLGQSVGAPAGPDGRYTAAQWQQGQQLAQNGPGTSTFFPEFTPPTYEAGPAYQAPTYEAGPAYQAQTYESGPAYQAQTYQGGPAYQAPDAFSYEGFRAPTQEEAQNDAGYQFAVNQGMKALEGSAAARGLARTGGALKDLINYGQQAGAQQYQNVYNRAAQSWGMNRDNAAQNYSTNYQVGRDSWNMNEDARRQSYDRNYRAGLEGWQTNEDARRQAYDRNSAAGYQAWSANEQARQGAFDRNTAAGYQGWQANEAARQSAFDRNYQGASDAFNARFRGRELTFEDLWRRWNTQVNVNAQMALQD